jgi:hypothetical protein
MSYQISWEPRGVYKKFTGHVTASEFLSSITDLQSSWDFDRVQYSINDFLEVQSQSINLDDVLSYAAHGIAGVYFNARVKVAIVTSSPAICALIKHYQEMVRFELRLFDGLDEARAWVAAESPPSALASK